MNLFNFYWHSIFSDFKWYRKKIGGTWYLIRELDVSGIASGSEYWDQKKPETMFDFIIGTEEYNHEQ